MYQFLKANDHWPKERTIREEPSKLESISARRRVDLTKARRHPAAAEVVRKELADSGGCLWRSARGFPLAARTFFELAGQHPVSKAEVKEGKEVVRRHQAIRKASIGLEYRTPAQAA